jgi:ankyrin repeat protein
MNARSRPGRPPEFEISRGVIATAMAFLLIALVVFDRVIYVRHVEVRALDAAVSSNDLDAIKAVLKEHPGLVSCKDRYSMTPLHYAVRDGSVDVVKLLLASKADVNARNRFGMTPLHQAVFSNRVDIAVLLVNGGADVNAEDNLGYTPLRQALRLPNLYKDMIQFLRKSGGHE